MEAMLLVTAAVAAAALLLPKRITITIAATTVDVIDDQVLGNLAMRVDFSKPEQYDVRTEVQSQSLPTPTQ